MTEFFSTPLTPLTIGIGAIYLVLAIATILVYSLKKAKPNKDFSELIQRTNSWWMMITLFSFALLGSMKITLFFVWLINFLALKEYISLIPIRRADRRVFFYAYLAIPIQLIFLYHSWFNMFYLFVPVFLFILIPLRMVTIGDTKGFIRSAGTIHWGTMICVFNLGHLAALAMLKPGGRELLLLLVVLCQFNDVAQFTWGKLFGKHPIIPKVSPKKTWEGFIGGVVTISIVSYFVSPMLSPLNSIQALFAGTMVAVSGFFGDVVISALKRDLGVKDSGNTIPGHGGILDRVDSLTFAAPLFYHLINYLYY